jgi:hypothetical protein
MIDQLEYIRSIDYIYTMLELAFGRCRRHRRGHEDGACSRCRCWARTCTWARTRWALRATLRTLPRFSSHASAILLHPPNNEAKHKTNRIRSYFQAGRNRFDRFLLRCAHRARALSIDANGCGMERNPDAES